MAGQRRVIELAMNEEAVVQLGARYRARARNARAGWRARKCCSTIVKHRRSSR